MSPGPALLLAQLSLEGKLPFVDAPELGPWTRDPLREMAEVETVPQSRRTDVVAGDEG